MLNNGVESYVCDLTLIMRSRLLCGMYNRRAVPPCWRGFAMAYCFIISIFHSIFVFVIHSNWNLFWYLHWLPIFSEYIFGAIVSLWTGDDYIYTFFTRNIMTDVTLDSPSVFSRFQKLILKTYFFVIGFHISTSALGAVMLYGIGYKFFYSLYFPAVLVELFIIHLSASNLLVFGLFNSRFLALRMKLERYGFRTIGRAPPQPYCKIHDEIWQGLDRLGNPFKLTLLINLLCNCLELTGILVHYIYVTPWQTYTGFKITLLSGILKIAFRFIYVFGHIALLESAAVHSEAMAVFTVTQLIKNPSAAERQRMYALLRALEQRGARYHVMRALPLDARVVLQAIGFCSAQAIVLINMLKEGDG